MRACMQPSIHAAIHLSVHWSTSRRRRKRYSTVCKRSCSPRDTVDRQRQCNWCSRVRKWPRVNRLTFDSVAEGVHAKGNGDEEREDFFCRPCRPSHEPRHVEQRIQDQEEGRPQTYAAVHGEKIQLEVFADDVDD